MRWDYEVKEEEKLSDSIGTHTIYNNIGNCVSGSAVEV